MRSCVFFSVLDVHLHCTCETPGGVCASVTSCPSAARQNTMTERDDGFANINTEDRPLLVKREGDVWSPHLRQSTFRTFFNVTKCFVGAASLELPQAVQQGGLVLSLVGILLLAVISYYTLVLLTRCGHLTTDLDPSQTSPTLPVIGRAAFGTVGAIVAYIGIGAMTLGVVGSYFVFMGSTLSDLLIQFDSRLTPAVMTSIVLPLIVLLSWLRSYRFLAPTSIIGVLCLFGAISIVLVDGFTHHSIQPISHYPFASWPTFPLFLGNAAFLYLIHTVILPTEQSMQNRSHYPRAVGASVILVTVVNVVFAWLAYLLYAECTQGNVIDNLAPGVLKIIVQIALTLDLIGSSVLFLLPPFELFERAIWDLSAKKSLKIELLRNVLRTVLVGAACGLALAIPCFSVLTGFSGGFGNCLMGLILPPALYLRLQFKRGYFSRLIQHKKKIAEIIVCCIVLAVGGIVFVLSTLFTVQLLADGKCGGQNNSTSVNSTCFQLE